jgi:hypothetical protein
MTKIGRVARGLLVAVGLLVWTKPAFAYIAATGASFVPYGPSDVNWIQHSTYSVSNTDPNASHYVTASLGVVSYSAGNHIWGYDVSTASGGTIECWITAIGLGVSNYHNIWQSHLSTTIPTTNGYGIGQSLNIQTAGKYSVTFTCLLPPSGAGYQIYNISD